jgi:hypothetical protein
MIELSYEANTAYLAALKAVHELVAVSVEGAAAAVNDPRGFALLVRDLSTQIQLSFEAFVGSVATDTRTKRAGEIVFPWNRALTGDGKREGADAPHPIPTRHNDSHSTQPATTTRQHVPSLGTAIGASVAMSFDALARLAKADEGMVLQVVPKGGGVDVQAACLFGTQRSPASVRFSADTGVVGAVLRTGMGLNISPDQPTSAYSAMLCFPIFSVDRRSEPIGVVMLERKWGTIDGFGKQEELLLEGFCQIAPKLLTGYGVPVSFDSFEVLREFPHLASSYKQIGKETALPDRKGTLSDPAPPKKAPGRYADAGKIATMLMEACGPAVGTSSGAMSKIASLASVQPPSLMVLRTTHHAHFTKSRVKPLHSPLTLAAQNIVDVAEYVATVEECWRRSTDDVQALNEQQVSSAVEVKERRMAVKELHTRIARLEEVANLYKERYEDLRLELMVACEAPIGEDSPP